MPEPHSETVLKLTIFSIVVALWALAFVVDIFSASFEVPVVVHGLVGTIIGYFVSTRLKKPGAP